MRISDLSSDVCSSDLRAPKEDIAESVETCPAETAFDTKLRAVLGVLGFDEDAPTVTGKGYHRPPFAPIFARLLELPDPVVLEIIAIVMGETLQAGSEAVEMIGLHIGTDMHRHWKADAAFFGQRSEEHTSELQSLMRNSYAVFCLKKKII